MIHTHTYGGAGYRGGGGAGGGGGHTYLQYITSCRQKLYELLKQNAQKGHQTKTKAGDLVWLHTNNPEALTQPDLVRCRLLEKNAE